MTEQSPSFNMAEPIKNMESSLGAISIFTINMGNQLKLTASNGGPVKNITPHDYIKKLAMYVCYRKADLRDGKYKPDQLSFSAEDIERLTDAELEEIAKIYVEGNDHLFRKHESKNETNANGQTVFSTEYTDIEHPKESDENYIHYLHRLACVEEERMNDLVKSVAASIPNLNSFSKNLSAEITKNLLLGESLTKTLGLGAMASLPTVGKIEVHAPKIPEIDWAAMEKRKEQIRREPFNDLAKRLDALIQFAVETNKTQTTIASEIKASSDATDKHAGMNIKLSYVVIVLTAIGLGFSAWATFSSEPYSKKSESLLGDMSRSLNQINATLANNHEDLEKNKQEIEKLQTDNVNYKNEISQLQEKISKLEAAQKKSRK